MTQDLSIRFGIDRLNDCETPFLQGARLGLLMNQASLSSNLEYAHDVVARSFPGQLAAIFTPQHGLWGEVQANMVESPHGNHSGLDVPLYSLYSETRRPTASMLSQIDLLIVDLQDVGTRVYTFVWTVMECLSACGANNVSMVVLDRPNPIGGIDVEGPRLVDGYTSFVGGAGIPMRHGLTIGELAVWLNREHSLQAELVVVPVTGWKRDAGYPLGRAWTPPSPNLPTLGSCLVYPGQVLFEGTNLSEGRGTTRPFEFCGAPFVDPIELSRQLTAANLPGVKFVPTRFTPAFDKWAGQSCGGVAIHVENPSSFRPYLTSTTMISLIYRAYPNDFAWLDPPYEYEYERRPIDMISGSDRLRVTLDRLAAGSLAADERSACLIGLADVDQEQWRDDSRDVWLYR
ncbi:MAG: DUF1343 domain-containing protein [Pirellulaceae bacterium]